MFPLNWHRGIFLFGLFGLAAGMLFGTVPTSIPQIILAANWVLEANYKQKWFVLKGNPYFWILVLFYVLHLLGMFYTFDVNNGLDDLRNKLPLLSLPIILFSSKPINAKEFKNLFLLLFLSVFVSSVYCFLVYSGFTKKTIIDVRQASVFMSHIRFSLFIAFSIIGMAYFVNYEKNNILKIALILVIIWLLFFMYKLQMVTGFLCLLLTLCILVTRYCYVAFSSKITTIIFVLFFGIVCYFSYAITTSSKIFEKSDTAPTNQLLTKTVSGRNYLQDTLFNLAENGNLITININDEELQNEWQKRSDILFSSTDKKGNDLRFTLLRYLASYGFTKDSAGISKLSSKDIEYVEDGFSNYKYTTNTGLSSRWRELVWELIKYHRGENPSGHTMSMRLEFWKTATFIMSKNPIVGVGTGDAQLEFNKAYIQTNSALNMDWRLRSHNQYLAVGVSFGLIGLLFFMIYLIYPCITLHKTLHALYWPFIIISCLSFLTEDTLETQSGVTFFIFFQTLFLWLATYKTNKIPSVV